MISLESYLLNLLGYGRFVVYNIEAIPIVLMRNLLGVSRAPDPAPPKNHRIEIFKNLQRMIGQDRLNIEGGIYSINVLYPESPAKHFSRYGELLKDAFSATVRSKYNINKNFSDEIDQNLQDLPPYYRRNFHFQTDGYLSAKSAELYAHQTEILFAGTLSLMRRLLLARLIFQIKEYKGQCKILELGCGTGESTKILLQSCPGIYIDLVDISQPYLEKAKFFLDKYSDATQFYLQDVSDFNKGEQYDIVFSSFLLHELPENVRRQVLQLSCRNLKTGGWMFHVDSLQLADSPNFDWALLQFPKDFHEPYYTNYIKTPLLSLLKEMELKHISQETHFLAKSVMAQKC